MNQQFLSSPIDLGKELDIADVNLLDGIGRMTGGNEQHPANYSLLAQVPERHILSGNHRKFYCLADVTITAGKAVNIYDVGGVPHARLADASQALEAHGYARLSAIGGAYCEISLFEGFLYSAGMATGQRYYLGTNGDLSPTPYADYIQLVGIALSPTILYVQINSSDNLPFSTRPVAILVRNATGGTLVKGSAVYINGAVGQRPTCTLAQANAEATSSKTLGLLVADVPNNSQGFAIIIGELADLNTGSFADGEALWLSATVAGGVTNVRPVAPNHAVFIGFCTYSHAVHGKVTINVQNGYELGELHDVSVAAPTAGQVLTYDGGKWVNSAPASLPARLGESCAVITNWDSAITNGWFMGDTACLNSPVPGYWTMGNVIVHSADWITQTVHCFTVDGEATTYTYRREKNAGVWGTWRRCVVTHSELMAFMQECGTFYINSTPTNGMAITTNIPASATAMVTVMVEGYAYGNSTPELWSISFYRAGTIFYNWGGTVHGGLRPVVKLGIVAGKILLFLEDRIYYRRLKLRVSYGGMGEDPSWFLNWTAVDTNAAAAGATEVTPITFTNRFEYMYSHGDGFLEFGPNSSGGARLNVGGNGTQIGRGAASICTTNGNLHLDSVDSGHDMYLNYYSKGAIRDQYGNKLATEVYGAIRAWVNSNGWGVVADSRGVSSVTWGGAPSYVITVYFGTAFSSINSYSATCLAHMTQGRSCVYWSRSATYYQFNIQIDTTGGLWNDGFQGTFIGV